MTNIPKVTICDICHPHYLECQDNWLIWRLVYQGCHQFVTNCLTKFSQREEDCDFNSRLRITPIPTFAKAAINNIKNSIFQRLVDIERIGGSKNYRTAIEGKEGGVDRDGSTLTSFIGRYILPELLTMSKVGIYIDMPPINGNTLADQQNKHPYLYMYKCEEIRSWCPYPDGNKEELKSVLLRDWVYACDEKTHLPTGLIARYRHLWVDDITGLVNILFYDDKGEPIYQDGSANLLLEPTVLNIRRIPFVVFQLSDSLLADIALHQIALLNLESSDIAFILKSNTPFYTEQQDERNVSIHLKGQPNSSKTGESTDSIASDREIVVGATQGRVYGRGLDRPDFIAPPTDNLRLSMDKQKQLKEDILSLSNLALSNIQPRMASAESKGLDAAGLEAGLSYIGLELEHGENKIAELWAMYEGTDQIATIKYPERYKLQSEEDRRADAKAVSELLDAVPSKTFNTEMAKKMVTILLKAKVTDETLEQIYKEVQEAPGLTGDAEVVIKDHEAGLVSDATASKLRGYPEKEVEQARKDKAERLKLIAISQSQGIRGATDENNEISKADKQINNDDPSNLPVKRGNAQ